MLVANKANKDEERKNANLTTTSELGNPAKERVETNPRDPWHTCSVSDGEARDAMDGQVVHSGRVVEVPSNNASLESNIKVIRKSPIALYEL